MDLNNLSIDNLHHAYLIEGEYEALAGEIISFLKKKGIEAEGNPDVLQKFFETISIDDSRTLKELQGQKSTSGGKKFFILGANFFGHEAANSLLKVFEEPAKDVHFFLITPNPHLLPATLKSRLSVISVANKKEINSSVLKEAKEFLNAAKLQRIKIIEALIAKFKDEDEEGEKKLKSTAIELLNAIESLFHEKYKDSMGEHIFEFEELIKVRDYLADRGASAKMLLEHLALILPTIK